MEGKEWAEEEKKNLSSALLLLARDRTDEMGRWATEKKKNIVLLSQCGVQSAVSRRGREVP